MKFTSRCQDFRAIVKTLFSRPGEINRVIYGKEDDDEGLDNCGHHGGENTN